MSKLKSDIIQKKYKENYLCKLGHILSWEGTSHVYSEYECNKCGKIGKSENPIRWECSQCKNYFCGLCYQLIIDKLCPRKHKYKWYKQNSIEYFSSFTCDNCFEKLLTKDGVFFDNECNITICPKCFYEACDIPDVLED